jgi:RimJ/RimL family protein N-acetyltransferase
MIAGNDWLRTDYRTLFRLRSDGRIECENDPDHSPGPRFWLAGCSEGNLSGVRADLSDDIAAKLQSLAASEPPFTPSATPKHLEHYLSLLDGNGSPEHVFGLIYELPHAHPYPSNVQLIDSEARAGRELVHSWAAGRIPEALFELGFREVTDFWAPWCAAMIDGEVGSIAFAARLADTGAELGLVTPKAFRGRGLASAATAGWSRLPALRSQTLYYSADRDNISSHRVAARLGLRLRGASLRIS